MTGVEHETGHMLIEILAILAGAAVFVPLAQRLGLGSILGYLAAGAVIGPFGLGLVGAIEDMRHVAEFGVAFLLFIIGIEMKPSRLWLMKRQVFGLGGLQVGLTGLGAAAVAWVAGLAPSSAVLVGLGLALSSTAMGLQILSERRELGTVSGRSAFAVLLFQDLMVPLLLTLTVLLADTGRTLAGDIGIAVLTAFGVLALAILGGRLLLRPLFRLVAAARVPDVFTATALLVVLGMGWLMEQVGLSMALGAFVAGLLLADSEYRHQVQADIQPFRGLLLGLFFIVVGMSVDPGLVVRRWDAVLAVVVGLMTFKALVLAPLLRGLGGTGWADAGRTALLLSGGGEFAFVLFGFARTVGVVDASTTQLLVVSVSLTMAATPLLLMLADRVGAATAREMEPEVAPEPGHERGGHVIIGGFGRVGRTVAHLLDEAGLPYIAFDLDLERVMQARGEGRNVYFGDASRAEVLRAGHADRARLVVITTDDSAATARTVAQIRHFYPELPIHVRARDSGHARLLADVGASATVPETLEASLQLGGSVLSAMGQGREKVARILETCRAGGYARVPGAPAAPDGSAAPESEAS